MKNKTLRIDKSNIFNTNIKSSKIPAIIDGEILLKIERFALTTNNITYAVTGEQLKYWDFFSHDNDQGIIPCWGFATVSASKNSNILEGEKIYGYFPMSNYIKIKAGKINDFSFMDMAEHRISMAPIYNTYNRLGEKIKYPEDVQDYVPIIQPLFATSFLNYQFINSESFFNADNIIITSASSKTALGLAFMLHKNKETDKKKIIGLTSTKNMDFVKSTGFYDEVYAYDEVLEKITIHPSIVVDMAGNGALLTKLYKHLGEDLKFISKIGLTDWTAASLEDRIPVAKFFFAPTAAKVFFEKHGSKHANTMIVKELFHFIAIAKAWIEIEYLESYTALETKYLEILKGTVDPSKGYILKENQ